MWSGYTGNINRNVRSLFMKEVMLNEGLIIPLDGGNPGGFINFKGW